MEGRDYYWIVRSEPEPGEKEGTDIWAIRQNKISITMLQGNLANSSQLRRLKTLCSALFAELRPTQVDRLKAEGF